MISIKATMIRLLAVVLLTAPLTGLQAANVNYATSGPILSMDSKHINVGDMLLRLSPTVKVVYPGNRKGELSNLNSGDWVGVTMIEYRGKAYVDSIYFLPNGSSAATELQPE